MEFTVPKPSKMIAEKPLDKRGRSTAPVQIELQLARWIAIIATHDNITQSAFLSDEIREYVTHHYKRVQKEMGKEIDDLGSK